QLLHGFQTQTLPAESDPEERLRVARRMGFLEADAFEADLARRRERLRGLLMRLFYESSGPTAESAAAEPAAWSDLPDLLDNLDIPSARDRLAERLSDAGFRDVPAALRALQVPMSG